MTLYIVIGILGVFIAAITGVLVANLIIKKKGSNIDLDSIEDKIFNLSQTALKNNNEQFLTLAKEVLGAQKTEIKTDLEGKKSALNELIFEIRKDIHKNEERLRNSDDERIKSFSALKSELENHKQITSELKGSTEQLKNLLNNNQTRGAFGEQVAENLLRMAGFVIGQDYVANQAQTTESTRPDFTLFLPDKTKLNIDVKFPYASLVKYTEAEDKTEKERYFRLFTQDVKTKINQLCKREYINTDDNTVDFVIMFIPNEMIFSFIYDKMNGVWEEAMSKKVILAGPFSFTAILRMVKQAYTNFSYQENLHQIIGLIQKFDTEYQKYSEAVDILGNRIESTTKQFEVVSHTRDKALGTVVDKIKSQNIIDESKDPQIKLME